MSRDLRSTVRRFGEDLAETETPLPPRLPEEGVAFGVCAGLAREWGVQRELFRLAFVLLATAWGLGFVAYGVCIFLMPARPSGERRIPKVSLRQALSENRSRLGSGRGGQRPWRSRSAAAWILGLAGAALLAWSTGLASVIGPLGLIGGALLAAGAALWWRAP